MTFPFVAHIIISPLFTFSSIFRKNSVCRVFVLGSFHQNYRQATIVLIGGGVVPEPTLPPSPAYPREPRTTFRLDRAQKPYSFSNVTEGIAGAMPPVTPSPYRATKKRTLEDKHDNSPKKRRVQPAHTYTPQNTYGSEVIDLTRDSPEPYTLPLISPNTKAKRTPKTPRSSQTSQYNVEKRRRKFRSSPPQKYLEKLHRATTQRYFNNKVEIGKDLS